MIPLGVGFTLSSSLWSQQRVAETINWPGYGNDPGEARFSPLSEIRDANVKDLRLAWSLDLPSEVTLEATPLAINGVIYFPGSNNSVYAVDAVHGKQLWRYQSEANFRAPENIRMVWPVNRGVAYRDGLVFIATRDCRMEAIDARTGKLVWSTSFAVPGIHATSSGAPRVFKDKVIIGNSGGDFGGRGYVTAFDAKTGKIAWRFFTVPGDPSKGFENEAMAMAAKTWDGEWWKYGGGGSAWNALTFDESLNQIYVGTSNGGPYNAAFRSSKGGDNLFLASVVALDADTGKYKWHYQFNPREVWDWKATADIILATIDVAGSPRKVLMQAPSNGFFYVIDRQTGKIVSAEKIGKVTWADRIDLKTGRPVERPGIRGENGPVNMYPDPTGLHNWQAMSYSPKTGLVYIPTMQMGMTYSASPKPEDASDVTDNPGRVTLRAGVKFAYFVDPKDPRDGRGALVAWDPVRQKARWRVNYPILSNAGTMVTAGDLVFQGTDEGKFYAYAADTGKKLWEFDAKLGIIAPPISFKFRGRQYVSLLVGSGGITGYGPYGGQQGWKYGAQPRRLLTFALGGTAQLPPTPPRDFSVNPIDDPSIKLDPARVAKGAKIYGGTCYMCHGGGFAGTTAGTAPDLRESGIAFDRQAFAEMVTGGSAVASGMPKYGDLSKDDIENLYQFIRSMTRDFIKARDSKAK
jgi:quinohemoprotein ethanol dehydrogenase